MWPHFLNSPINFVYKDTNITSRNDSLSYENTKLAWLQCRMIHLTSTGLQQVLYCHMLMWTGRSSRWTYDHNVPLYFQLVCSFCAHFYMNVCVCGWYPLACAAAQQGSSTRVAALCNKRRWLGPRCGAKNSLTAVCEERVNETGTAPDQGIDGALKHFWVTRLLHH